MKFATKPVEVNIQLTHREAQALAQLVKRLGFSDCCGSRDVRY